MKAYSAIFASLAMVAVLVSSASAQGEIVDGGIMITVDCGSPERVTVANGTDETLVLEGISSSKDQESSKDREGDPEVAFNVEIASYEVVTRELGTSGGSGDIFENGAMDWATVYLSGREYLLHCGAEYSGGDDTDTVVFTLPGDAGPAPVSGPGQDTDGGDEQQGEAPGEMPEELPDTGAGALTPAAGIPLGNVAAGLGMLVGAGYAVLRRR